MKKLITFFLLIGLCAGLLAYNFSIAEPETEQKPAQKQVQAQAPEPARTEPATQPTEPVTQPAEQTLPPVGQVRIANADTEQQAAWEALAEDYTRRTGVSVTVVPGDDPAATLFTVRSMEELAGIQEQCLDLSGTDAHAQLASWDLTLEAGGKICGIAAEIEGFGLICNSGLLGQLATLQEITGLSSLKTLAQTITADEDLDFAAFACPDLEKGFAARLVSVGVDCREFWEVYSANAACPPDTTGKTDSLSEFVNGKAVFYLGSTSDYGPASKLGDHNLGMMPLYLGGEDEQRQGLCVTCSSYWCVRGGPESPDAQATVEFLNDLVRPREDGTVPVDDLRIVAPYRQAAYAANLLERTLRTDLAAGKEYVVCQPDVTVPAELVAALRDYAAEPTDEKWAAVAAFLTE